MPPGPACCHPTSQTHPALHPLAPPTHISGNLGDNVSEAELRAIMSVQPGYRCGAPPAAVAPRAPVGTFSEATGCAAIATRPCLAFGLNTAPLPPPPRHPPPPLPPLRRQMKVVKGPRATTAFVEFCDVASAMLVHQTMQGVVLQSSDRGGVRLQFSKNPFGRRDDASADQGAPAPAAAHAAAAAVQAAMSAGGGKGLGASGGGSSSGGGAGSAGAGSAAAGVLSLPGLMAWGVGSGGHLPGLAHAAEHVGSGSPSLLFD
jgi:hypothetical protein